MKNGITTTVTLLVAFAALCAGLFAWRLTLPTQVPRAELERQGLFLFDQPRELQPFSLPATHKAALGNADLAGRWTVLFFGFTHCPDVCPTTLAELGKAVRSLPGSQSAQLQVWLVSVDPERDTLEKLRAYLAYFDEGFQGITGTVPDLARFARMFNAVFARAPGGGEHYQVDHSAHLAVVAPDGRFIGILRPPIQAKRLRDTLDLLLVHYPFEVRRDS